MNGSKSLLCLSLPNNFKEALTAASWQERSQLAEERQPPATDFAHRQQTHWQQLHRSHHQDRP